MGRSICVWLLVCLALASAIPVPGPSTSQDLLNMILNAKPEDNDIAIHPKNPQPLTSIARNEADIAEPQVVPPKGEGNQDVPLSVEPHETPESEAIQEVPEQEQQVPEPQIIQINNKLIPPITEANMQTKQEVEDKIPVPEEKDLQTEPEEVMPLDEEQIFPVPQEQISPVPQEQIFPAPQEQIFPVPQEQMLPVPQEQIFLVPQEQIFPAPEEQIYPVPLEQQVIWEPEEDQIISEPEVYIVPILEEEEERMVPEDEESFPVIEEEIIPVYEEEIFPKFEEEFSMDEEEEINPVYREEEPIESYEVRLIPIHEEETEFNPELDEESVFNENEERMPILEPEDIPEVIVVNLEDFEHDQPISYEPMIPGYVNEEPSDEMEDSPLGLLIPPYFEDEEPQEEIPAMYEESQGPVYFDTLNVPEPFRVVYETPEGYMEESMEEQDEEMEPFMITDTSEESMEMPNEEMRPFIFSDSSEDQVPDTEIFSDEVIDENSDEELFAGSVFPVNPEGYYEEGPGDDVLVDYYIPMSDLPVEDARYETDEFDPEYQAPQEESAQHPDSVILDIFHTMAVMPEGITPEYESENFDEEEDPIEEFFTPELFDQEDDDHDFMDEPHINLEPMMNEDERPDISEIIQDTLNNDDQVFLEIIPYDPQSFDVKPEDVLKINAQQITANEEIIPIAEFPEREMTPIEEIYWIPENTDEQQIIFPEDAPPQRNLPVFPYQWSEENYFQPPRNQHESPQYDQQPYYGPFPQEEPQFMFDMPNDDDMTPNRPDFMPPSQGSDMPREDMFLTMFDDDDMNLDLSDVLYQSSEISDYPKKFMNPSSFDLPSLSDMALNQEFHGPNTFPLNFRRPGVTPNFFHENLNSYNRRFTPQYNNHDRIYPENLDTPKDFHQGSNYHNTPNSMPNTPNMFFPMLTEADKMFENPNEQDMNMNLKVFRPSSMPMNSDRFNQRQEQFDVQVFYIPYRNKYNSQRYGQYDQRDYRRPYAQQSNTYQEQSYNVNPYGGSNTYQNPQLYPRSSVPNRYTMNNNYRDHYHYHPYNFPMSNW